MSNKAQSLLKFKNYIIESIEFRTNFTFSGEDKDIKFDFDNSYEYEDDNFILKLNMVIFPEAEQNDYPFSMKVEIIGLFEVDSSADDEIKISFAEKNAIAILFPYLRALVSVYTSNANIGTTILPPINVVKYLNNKKNTENK